MSNTNYLNCCWGKVGGCFVCEPNKHKETVPSLTKKLAAAKARIKTLEARIKTLEAKLRTASTDST